MMRDHSTIHVDDALQYGEATAVDSSGELAIDDVTLMHLLISEKFGRSTK
jgi:hypothetical protein